MSKPITEHELDAIREAQEVYMPEKVLVQRQMAIGGGTFSWRNVTIDVAARITAGFGRFISISDKFTGITPFVISMPAGTDVKAGDRIIDEASRIYEVRTAARPKSFLTAVQVLCDFIND